jgi:signal transduction histidine kinase
VGDLVTVRHMLESRDGSLWLASSRRGAFRFSHGEIHRVITPYSSAAYLCEDREGSMWLATDGHGIAQLRTKAYRVINAAAGLGQDAVSALTEDSDGAMWLANRTGGLVRVAPDGTLHRPGGLEGADIFPNTVAFADGLLWFGGARNPFFRWNPARPEPPVATALPGTEVQLLFRARNGDVWFAVGSRVGYLRNNVPHVFSSADGYDAQDVRAIAQEPDGTIWIGSRAAVLQRWDGRRFERFAAEQGLPRLPIHALAVDGGGNLWIATAAGLVLKDGSQFRTVTEADGLADDILMQIVEDDRDRLWFAARRGLFYAARTELLAAARTGGAKIVSHMFGRNEGLQGFTATPNYYPAAAKARDGRLWFATAQGAVAVDPEKLPRGLPAPPIVVDEVRLDGQVLPKHAALRIPSGQRRLEFRFSALSYVTPESVVLRHRLEGADTRWIDTGSDRAATYTNLAPGGYRMHVMARNSAGQWNTEGAALAFVVVPAWWETLWFRSGAALLLAVCTAWLARALAQRRFKLKLLRLEQAHALEKERARIARDLHDDLGASLTEVGLLADRLVGAVPREFASQLSGLAWRTRRLATELSGIVWTMSAQNSSLDRLAEFLRRYAERLFRNTGTACVVQGVEGIPPAPLPPDRQHQLLAAAKEALNNILKHARATEAVMQMRYAGGVFELRIADNGAGFAFDPAVAPEGNGLRNMRTRAEEIGGTFELASGPGGTCVVVRVPCPPDAAPP